MKQKRAPVFDNYEFDQFERLIGQESYTPLGQIAKIALIKQIFTERYTRAVENRAKGLRPRIQDSQRALRQAQEDLRYQMLDLLVGNFDPVNGIVYPPNPLKEVSEDPDVRHHKLIEWNNLIITRGNPNAPYHVFIPAHVDTVKGQLELRRQGDRLMGGGVWDMQAGVLNNIALAAEVVPAQDVCAHFGFILDEELHSRGAKAIKTWSRWRLINTVISQEIGPLSVPPEDDDTQLRVILARRGRHKFKTKVELPHDSVGHFSLRSKKSKNTATTQEPQKVLNAHNFVAQISQDMQARFTQQAESEKHPLLGPPEWSPGRSEAFPSRLGIVPDKGYFEYSIFSVPGISFEQQTERQERLLEQAKKAFEWRGDIGSLEQFTGGTSYDGYTMPIEEDGTPSEHPLTDLVFRGVKRVTGIDGVPAGALSVSDEDVYAVELLKKLGLTSFDGANSGVISIPPRGNHAHNPAEWVSASSLMQVRELFRWLLEDPHGFRQIAGWKGRK